MRQGGSLRSHSHRGRWVLAVLLGAWGMGLGSVWGETPPDSDRIPIVDARTGRMVLLEPVRKGDAEWQRLLSPEQFDVLRLQGTERPFTGAYLHHTDGGIYQCAACGTDLFNSDVKYDSSTGWPSFWEPVATQNILLTVETNGWVRRTEIRCARCGSHLGHVFDDGPPPTGLRYCINSAALQFTARDEGPGTHEP